MDNEIKLTLEQEAPQMPTLTLDPEQQEAPAAPEEPQIRAAAILLTFTSALSYRAFMATILFGIDPHGQRADVPPDPPGAEQ